MRRAGVLLYIEYPSSLIINSLFVLSILFTASVKISLTKVVIFTPLVLAKL